MLMEEAAKPPKKRPGKSRKSDDNDLGFRSDCGAHAIRCDFSTVV